MKYNIYKLFLFCFFYAILFYVPMSTYSMINDIRFRHITIEDGLSQNSAFTIVQDELGFMWIGTETGLNRYDGYTFKIFTSNKDDPATISNSYILSICKSLSGELWIGTENGLNRFDYSRETFTRFFNNPNDSNSISGNRILRLITGRNGLIWIGTVNGLSRYNPDSQTFTRFIYKPDGAKSIGNNEIQALMEDRNGRIWIGTANGLNVLDPESGSLIVYRHVEDSANSLSNNNIRALCEDKNGIVWIGTNFGGLNRFDPNDGTFIHYQKNQENSLSISDNQINFVFEDKTGVLWIGTNTGGINRYDKENNSFINYIENTKNINSLSNNRIYCITEDNHGGIWFGTASGGINIYYHDIQKFTHYRSDQNNLNSLSSNSIRPIYEDLTGILWVGTDGGGLNRIDRKNNQYSRYLHDPYNKNSLCDNRVFSIYEEDDGVFWLATNGGGLDKFDSKNNIFTHFTHNSKDSKSIVSNNLRTLLMDRSGLLWIGSQGSGISCLNMETGEFHSYKFDPDDPNSISGDRIYRMYEDKQGVLWIGTFGKGMCRYVRDKDHFVCYSNDPLDKTSVSDNYILAFCEDSKGVFWFGTLECGLNKLDRKTKKFSNYTVKDGLANNVVYDIIEDNEGNLWMSTNRGISKFDTKTEMFKNYDVKDGVQSYEFNLGAGYKSRSGELFFGGINGFNSFYPDSIRDDPYKPQIVITDLLISNESVPIGTMASGRTILNTSILHTQHVRLNYRDNVLSFEFAALHYVYPERNQYSYILEGLDKKWNNAGTRRYVTYSGLAPGEYAFRVIGSNCDDIWNKDGIVLKITIVPPFWKTWWFYLMCFFVVMSITAVFFNNHINKLEKEKEEEEKRKVTQNFSQALEQGNVAVYRKNFDKNIYEYMGDGVEEITGYTVGEITPKVWDDIVINIENKGELAGLSNEVAYQRIRKGLVDNWITDFYIEHKNGEKRWVMDMSTALRDSSNHCYGCLGIIFDITTRKLDEQKLAETTKELSIQNEEMETDLNMARDIQMALLAQHDTCFPRGTTFETCAMQFSHIYIPATSLAGDFFFILPISHHEVGVLICDVMGHGARASLLTFYLRGLMEELKPVAADTSQFMKKLNLGLSAIMRHFRSGMFATAFYMVINVHTGKIRYCNAGHPAPLIQRRVAGKTDVIHGGKKTNGPALGLKRDFVYITNEDSVEEDDVILLFTDGLYEVVNTEEIMLGRKQLYEIIQKNIYTPSESMLGKIFASVSEFSASDDLYDDVCFLSMHVKHLIR